MAAPRIFLLNVAAMRPLHPSLLRLLNSGEQDRARRMAAPGAHDDFVVGRGVLRLLLAGQLGIPPQQVQLCSRPAGKPFLCGMDAVALWFNVSHAHGLVAIAVSREGELGIDVEWLDPEAEVLDLALCAWGQQAALDLRRLAPGPERQRSFFERWVRFEARSKLEGTGIGAPSWQTLHGASLPLSKGLHHRNFTISARAFTFVGSLFWNGTGDLEAGTWLDPHEVAALVGDKE